MPELLRITEAAALLGVSPRTLRRWDQTGRLRPVRHPISGQRLYPRDQLDGLLSVSRPPPRRPDDAFIGRAEELAEVGRALEAPGAVLSLLGPPGVGKTRLALEFVSRAGQPLIFLDLSAASDLPDLIGAAAAALALPLAGSLEEALDEVGAALAERGVALLVLDAVEALLAPVATALQRWRAAAPALRTLLTSRQPLEQPWERALLLRPLPAETEGLDLLLARIRARRPRFRPGASARDALRAQCKALDGLPLALELLAASLAQEGAGAAAAASPPDPSPLRAAVARSWALLTPEARQALVCLSVFPAPFTRLAATAVLRAPQALDLLAQRSLVQREILSGEVHFRLLSAIRDFAAEEDPALRDEAAARQAEALAAELWAPLHPYLGALRPEQLEALRARQPLLSAAFQDALRLGRLPVAVALGRALLAADQLPGEGLRQTAALVADPRVSPRDLGLLVLQRSIAARRLMHNEQAEHELALGLRGAQDADDLALAAHLAVRTASFVCHAGRIAEAGAHLDRAEAVFAARGDPAGLAAALHARGILAIVQNLPQETLSAVMGRAAEALRAAGDLLRYASQMVNLARFCAQRRSDDSLDLSLAALEAAQEARTPTFEAFAQVTLGLALHDRGELARARERLRRGEQQYRTLGLRARAADAALRVALVDLEAGDLARATEQAAAAAALSEGGPRTMQSLSALVVLAVEAHAGDAALALVRLAERERTASADWLIGPLERLLALLIRRAGLARQPDPTGASRGEDAAPARAVLEEEAAAIAGNQTLRCLARLIRRAEEGARAPQRLWVSADGQRFRAGVAPEVDLSRRHAPARLLGALARAREAAPGQAIPIAELAEAGWPGERMRADSAAQRVRTALWSLRGLGLKEAIETVEGGYRLAPDVALRREQPDARRRPIGPLALDAALLARLDARCAAEDLSLEAAVEQAIRRWLGPAG